MPPVGNANYAWLQHFAHMLSPSGTAGIVLANGSMNSNSGGEGEIRKNMIEAGLIDCMVALPAQLFYNTMIPACLWFLARNKANGKFRNRSGEILLIDARKLGALINRRNKEFSDDDITLIADTYHSWRCKGEPPCSPYEDIPGFCKSATLEEVRKNNHVLMPGRYVGAEAEEDDGIPFDDKMKALTAKLAEQFGRGRELEMLIRENLKGIGYEL
jgi:type I restriction enzyme M protein